MNYTESRTYLLNQFNNNNFDGLFYNKRTNQASIAVANNFNLNLTIAFPGYKTQYKHGHLVYDYRVDLNKIPISHTNIVTDIYNKAIQAPQLVNDLYKFLIDLSFNALNIDLNKYQQLLNHNFQAPSTELLTLVKKAHGTKQYNINGNAWSYSLKELSTIIPYIVLQEDINYPMPRFNGRRMSFYRYVEAIFCSLNNNYYTLQQVIVRTLSHTRPALWNEFNQFYQPITKLANI